MTRPENTALAKILWGKMSQLALDALEDLTKRYSLRIGSGDLLYLQEKWYVTHAGLLGIARRKHCAGIVVKPVPAFCDASAQRWAFAATVYKSKTCRGFVGHGDADPSNVSPLVHGAEMRVAETRAVNRALRKAYGIGICSIEELGSIVEPRPPDRESRKVPPQSANGNYGGPKVRDRLCALITRHQLDAGLVKSYACDFCSTKQLRDATRDQVEAFVTRLAEQAETDRDSLLCQLNSYAPQKEGAA